MKFNIQKMMDIKTPKDLEKINLNKPVFYKNYLFHYLIMFDKLELLKINKHPVFHFNEENLDGFMLAAKYDNINILKYLIKEYPNYIQNHNSEGLNFINYISEPKQIIQIIKDFPNINWEYLLKFKNNKNINFYCFIISQLDINNIEWFISKYKFNSYYTLSALLLNELLNDSEKITIFDKFTDEEINNKNYINQGLIIDLINSENIKLTKYFVERDLDLEYIINPITLFISPFFYLYSKIIINSKTEKYIKKIEELLEIIWNKIKLDYNYMNKDGINYVQLVLDLDTSKYKSKILDKIVNDILLNSPNESWTHVNLKKETALFYLVKYPIEKYFKYIKNKQLNVSQKNNKDKTVLDMAPEEWCKELIKLNKYKDDNTIDLDLKKYQHQTKFTATITDIKIYFIYLSNKYKNLYIPKINNLNTNHIDYSWIINYEKNKIDIHPNLNMCINNIRRTNEYDYVALFLSQTLDDNLKHANIILYDFKNLSIERFEPYGDDGIESEIDDILDEELSWNTGMTYLRPNMYLPKPGYQLLSNENNIYNQKVGDFGGFCLGWCIWYIEHRIKNNNIDSITLNKKTLEKLLKLDDSLNEFIRNYSNKLFDEKYKILKNICPENKCIKEKNISNLILSNEETIKIRNYTDQFFSYHYDKILV
jgi:hypothetical protein